jgi:hypothetical protein
VVAWLNGHTHVHAVTAVTGANGAGFWQITTASHIDWPQQARIVEFLSTKQGLVIGCTVIDSAAPASYRADRSDWLRWPASSPPMTGRYAISSRLTAARARAARRTATPCCWSTGPGRPGSSG